MLNPNFSHLTPAGIARKLMSMFALLVSVNYTSVRIMHYCVVIEDSTDGIYIDTS